MKSLITFTFLIISPLLATLAAEPQWIWSSADAAKDGLQGECIFRKTFQIDDPQKAELLVACDNEFEAFVNGRRVGGGNVWQKRYRADILPLLVPGRNVIAVRGVNATMNDPAGLAVQINLTPKGKEPVSIVSDKSWKFSRTPGANWHRVDTDDSRWSDAFELGPYGKTPPWGATGTTIVAMETGAATAPAVAAGKANRELGHFQLRDGDRIAFLGGTFVERMNTFGYFETALAAAYPRTNFTLRNLGWSGDTVWGDARAVFGGRADGMKRLLNDTLQTKPTVLLLCYGENEAYAGEAGLAEFRRGYEQLLTALEPSGARMVLIAPRQHETLGPPLPDQSKYNESLLLYRDAIREIAADRSAAFVDLSDALFSPRPKNAGEQLTDNGIHLSGYGEWRIAGELVKRFGGRPPVWSVDFDLKHGGLDSVGTAVSDVKAGGDRLSFTAADRTLPMPGLASEFRPLNDSAPPKSHRLRVRGLSSGIYLVRFDKADVATTNADGLAAGIDFVVPAAEQQAEQLRQAILKKNELFFHRYRPQNETYLFLFRKHEQGNNAVEIPQFDPLVETQEKEIARLKTPGRYAVEIVPIGM